MLRGRRNSRKHVRRPFRYNGWLRSDRTSAPIRCVLFDVSAGGARLSASATHSNLPSQFILELAGTVIRRRCEIVWRDECYIGVKFLKQGKV
jgi:hypothetical protein